MADSATGCVINFEIYTGAKKLPDDKGAMYHTVMRLLENHLDQGYCVYMNNYYSSPTVFTGLLAKNTDAVEAYIPRQVNFPKNQLNSVRLKKGESIFVQHDDLTASRFYEKEMYTCYRLTM